MPDKTSNDWLHWEPEEEWRMHHVAHRLTPCELLRQIYKKTDDKQIKMWARIATSMAKSMANRLTVYEGQGWGHKIFPRNPFESKKQDSAGEEGEIF